MSQNTQARLKTFLERNRNRISSSSSGNSQITEALSSETQKNLGSSNQNEANTINKCNKQDFKSANEIIKKSFPTQTDVTKDIKTDIFEKSPKSSPIPVYDSLGITVDEKDLGSLNVPLIKKSEQSQSKVSYIVQTINSLYSSKKDKLEISSDKIPSKNKTLNSPNKPIHSRKGSEDKQKAEQKDKSKNQVHKEPIPMEQIQDCKILNDNTGNEVCKNPENLNNKELKKAVKKQFDAKVELKINSEILSSGREKSPRYDNPQTPQDILLEKAKELFSESLNKLNVMNKVTPNDNEFKNELKTLMKVIKNERKHIAEDLVAMMRDINKYKWACKKLRKKLKKEIQNSSNKSNPILVDNIKNDIDQPRESLQNEKEKELDRISSAKVQACSEEKIGLICKNEQPLQDQESFQSNNNGLKYFGLENDVFSGDELENTSLNQFVIQDMNLSPSLFFKAHPKESIENPTSFEAFVNETKLTPTIADLITSQRQVMNFLVKRLQNSERSRLVTEEKASQIVLSMEEAIQKRSPSRSRKLYLPIDSNQKNKLQGPG